MKWTLYICFVMLLCKPMEHFSNALPWHSSWKPLWPVYPTAWQKWREPCCYLYFCTQPTCRMFSKINATFPIKALFQLGSIHLPTLLQALLLFTSSLLPKHLCAKAYIPTEKHQRSQKDGEKSLAVPRQRLIIQSVHAFAAVAFV